MVQQIEQAGQLDNTLIVFLADHGRYVGAHGFDAHNFGPVRGDLPDPAHPGRAGSLQKDSRAGRRSALPIWAPRFATALGRPESTCPDSRSFHQLLDAPHNVPEAFSVGYAEYHGTRFPLMQRILWQGAWKFVFKRF